MFCATGKHCYYNLADVPTVEVSFFTLFETLGAFFLKSGGCKVTGAVSYETGRDRLCCSALQTGSWVSLQAIEVVLQHIFLT